MNISVIIPVYNGESTIEACLENIKQGTVIPKEIIVVNDASSDNTQSLLDKFSDIKVITLKKKSGVSHARNEGAKRATGEILIFVDCDVLVSSESLCNAKSFFQSNRDVCAISGQYIVSKKEKTFCTEFKESYMQAIHSDLPLELGHVLGGICAIRKKDFIKWNINCTHAEDTEWGQRLSLEGKKIVFLSNFNGVHLKIYNLFSLIKNDFLIARGFVEPYFFYLKELEEKKSFSHVSKNQQIAVILSFLFVLLLISGAFALSLIALVLFFIVNRRILLGIISLKRLNLFMIMTLMLISSLAHGAGILIGTCEYARSKAY